VVVPGDLCAGLLHNLPLGSGSGKRPSVLGVRGEEPLLQCRKWRMPVKTMAMPAALAASMTRASRTEPPG
jgi:hypothetical protein